MKLKKLLNAGYSRGASDMHAKVRDWLEPILMCLATDDNNYQRLLNEFDRLKDNKYMKIKLRISRLDFRKDPTFDVKGLVDEYHATPYVVEYKRHWWNRWRYIIDNGTHCPRLFYGDYNSDEVRLSLREQL